MNLIIAAVAELDAVNKMKLLAIKDQQQSAVK